MKLLAASVLLIRISAAQTLNDLVQRAEAALDTDPAQAASLFKEALERRPSWPEGWFYLGGALYRLDRYAEARDAFSKGLDLSPRNGVAWGFLGLAEYELGDLDASASSDRKRRKLWARFQHWI